jgi:hypothetical protein
MVQLEIILWKESLNSDSQQFQQFKNKEKRNRKRAATSDMTPLNTRAATSDMTPLNTRNMFVLNLVVVCTANK